MRPLQGFLRRLAKEQVIPRAYFDTVRCLPECCHALPQGGLGYLMLPSGKFLRSNSYEQPRGPNMTPMDPLNTYSNDTYPLQLNEQINEYYLITKIHNFNKPGEEVYRGVRLGQEETPVSLLEGNVHALAREEILPQDLVFSSWRVIGPGLSLTELSQVRARFHDSLRPATPEACKSDRKFRKVQRILQYRADQRKAKQVATQKAAKEASQE